MKPSALLCVDDDPGIRQFYEILLGNSGYEVLLAVDGRDAVKIFRSRKKTIDAVITDYEMPGMNGFELASELKRSNPELPILMVSGSAPNLEGESHPVDASLPKGSSIHALVEQVEQLLARHQLPPPSFSRFVPLGSALAGIAMAGFLIPKLWK